MNDSNEKPISVDEMLDRFDIKELKYEETGFVRHISLADTNLGVAYTYLS